MKKTFLLAVTALVALMAASCQKEELGRILTATIEQYEHNGDSKAYINDDNYACWEAGDKVKINNVQCTVSVSQGNEHNYTATIEGQIPTDQDLLAFYPASQVSDLTASGGTVTLPPVQEYRENNGHQVIDNPMAAYCPAGSDVLKFRNLCALVKITIQAPENEGLSIKDIRIKGDDDQKLWGTTQLILDNQRKPMLNKIRDGGTEVCLSLGDHPATISAGSSKSFYIVVPAPSTFYDFSIVVITGQNEAYWRKTSVGQALLRNQIGALVYIPNEDDKGSIIHYTGSVDGFRSDAFGGAKMLSSDNGNIIFDRPLSTIGNEAFMNCYWLSSITLPEGVTSIGNKAFMNCSRLNSISLPAGVTSIGDYTFMNCPSLSNITLPEGVTSIGEAAFAECSSLSSIDLPDSLTSIGESAFAGCIGFSSIDLPEGVTSIRDHTFYRCLQLSSITLPEGVTSIGTGAFAVCASLITVNVNRFKSEDPINEITRGGSDMFYRCHDSLSIYVPAGAEDTYKAAEGWNEYRDKIEAQQ